MFFTFNKHESLESTKKIFMLSEDNTNSESQEEMTSEAKSGILPNVMPNVSSWTKVLEDTVSLQLFYVILIYVMQSIKFICIQKYVKSYYLHI